MELRGKNYDNFKSAIKKLAEQEEKMGFKNSILNEDESKLIIEMNKNINQPK